MASQEGQAGEGRGRGGRLLEARGRDGASVAGHRMLVVDDEAPILFALDEYFRRLGFVVDTAQELEEAQALLRCRSYRVVIADLQLRKISGVEGLELLRWAREHSPATRFILLTAHGSDEVEAEARRSGVDAFLHKPEPLGRLATLVESLLEGGGSNDGSSNDGGSNDGGSNDGGSQGGGASGGGGRDQLPPEA